MDQLNERLGPIFFAGICALLAGGVNPPFLQARDVKGTLTGHPSYVKMAVFTMLMGLVGIALFKIPNCF